jgi:hypothetical protein
MGQTEKRWGTNDDIGSGLFIRELRGKTVGILGYGHIGREAGRLSAAFGAKIIAANSSGEKKPQDGYIVPGTGDPDGRCVHGLRSNRYRASYLWSVSQKAGTRPATQILSPSSSPHQTSFSSRSPRRPRHAISLTLRRSRF